MNIIIDGYNIIKQIFKSARVAQKEHDWFMGLLVSYTRKKKHTIYIVFDAGPYERPTAEKTQNIIKVYSGRHKSADDVIKAYIEEQLLKPLLIVTTDRQINRYAARHNIPSIDSLDFYTLMKEEKSIPVQGLHKASGTAFKLHQEETSPELDELMQEAAKTLYYKVEEHQEDTKSGHKKVAKDERQMIKILKKL